MIANLKDALWLRRQAKKHGKLYLYDPPKWEQKAEKSRIIRWTLARLRNQGRAVDMAFSSTDYTTNLSSTPWTPPV